MILNDKNITDYSESAFIQLASAAGALKFGRFTLKSGRISPYFFNAGLFYHALSIKRVGDFYANKLIEKQVDCEHLFGPAYKGIPLATATGISLAERGINTTLTFNRKEIKHHGEGGQLIGAPLSGATVIIDDVITAGTAYREAKTFIESHGGQLKAVIIALDRCERGLTNHSTLTEIRSEGIEVLSLITLHDLITYLERQGSLQACEQLHAYQREYGIDG